MLSGGICLKMTRQNVLYNASKKGSILSLFESNKFELVQRGRSFEEIFSMKN